VPGKDAPSCGIGDLVRHPRLARSPPAQEPYSLDAGFRIDNSAKSVDHPNLSEEDQVSLGVSKFHAALAGASSDPTGARGWVGIEVHRRLRR
jgi:hypothetical protein